MRFWRHTVRHACLRTHCRVVKKNGTGNSHQRTNLSKNKRNISAPKVIFRIDGKFIHIYFSIKARHKHAKFSVKSAEKYLK